MFSKQFRSIIFLHGAAWKNQFTQQHSFDWSRADGARQAELAKQVCFLRFDCNLGLVSKAQFKRRRCFNRA